MLVDSDGHFFWFVVNAGFAAYEGYQAYKYSTSRGYKGWKKWGYIAGAVALGGLGISKGYKVFRLTKIHKATSYVDDVVNQIINRNGAAPKGYKGGKVYNNRPKKRWHWKLPKGSYKEYDVHPYVRGKNRGAERVVINQHNGRVYYTKNHYKTFKRIR